MSGDRGLKRTQVLSIVRVDQSGFTLVELMVSMGLFMVTLMAVLSLFTYGSTQSLRILFTQNSQQALMDFQENFDTALNNVTRTYTCGCDRPTDGNRRNCIFSTAAANWIVPEPAAGTNDSPDVATAAGTTSYSLLDFEAEYSQTPLDPPLAAEAAAAYCQYSTNATNGGVSPEQRDRPHLGCKRAYRLRFYNANPENNNINPAPGFLYAGRVQLMVCTGRYYWTGAAYACGGGPYGAAAQCAGTSDERCDNGFIRIAEIPGVRGVDCGQEIILGDTTTAADNFRLDFTYINSVTDNPDIVSIQAGIFSRSYSFSANFRNLTERGVYFSRASKTANCTPNNATPVPAVCADATTCSDNPCCSGRISFAGEPNVPVPATDHTNATGAATCWPKNSCWPSGHQLHDAMWPQQRFSCCSNQAVLKDFSGTDRYECL